MKPTKILLGWAGFWGGVLIYCLLALKLPGMPPYYQDLSQRYDDLTLMAVVSGVMFVLSVLQAWRFRLRQSKEGQ